MKKKYLFLLAALCLLMFSYVSASGSIQAPDFRAYDLKLKYVSSNDYIGKKPVILFFWTTWCSYCRKEMGGLKDKCQKISSDGVELFAVNVEESQNRVERFMENYSWFSNVLLDRDAQVAYSYGILGFPTYIFIDKNGKIVFRGNSFTDNEYSRLLGK